MRSLLLLPILSSLCAALAVSGGTNERFRSHSLSGRADKTPDNPDGEDGYIDPVSKAATPRSRILPFGDNGVNQPKDAEDRIFDWDSSYYQILPFLPFNVVTALRHQLHQKYASQLSNHVPASRSFLERAVLTPNP